MTHRATYSAEDNKLRIYPDNRLDDELGDEGYKEFKAAGYKWAAKQECFVCACWTPDAEDWALDLCGEIDDEDYSPEERSADRAERFGGYRDKRRGEAHGHADDYESRPAVFGHQSQARAERQARRHDRHRHHALSQWSKAEYWQQRTEGVIRHALYRSSAPVRRSRLLRLEAEQRKHVKALESYRTRYEAWKAVAACEDAEKSRRLAWTLANTSHEWGHYQHPRQPNLKPLSMYCLLDDRYTGGDPITGKEAAALWLANAVDPYDETRSWHRWTSHYDLRIGYERAMLAAEGGMASEADIEPGGWIRSPRQPRYCLESAPTGWVQVVSVHRSPATKRVTSVKVQGWREYYDEKENTRKHKPALVTCSVERLAEDAYRPPTDEERAAFKAQQAEAKAERKATTSKAPPLINPTDDDAERLQAVWNAWAQEKHAEKIKADGFCLKQFEPAQVLRITQAVYSANSKGDHAKLETRALYDDGKLSRRFTGLWTSEGQRWDEDRKRHQVVCKLRIRDYPDRVIVITDKPQKPIPLDWEKLLADEDEREPVTCGAQKELF